MKICVVGSGYVGLVTGTCLAEMGNAVVAVDKDPARIEMLQRGEMPIYEPGLAELVERNIAEGRLDFTTNVARGIEHALIIFICVGTPPADDGSTDLTALLAVTDSIAKYARSYKVVVVKSTVPAGTCRLVADILAEKSDCEFDVASNPEFLKEGAAVDDFFRPDRVVVGAESERALKALRRLYAPFLRTGRPLITMKTTSAEMTKHASNAILAARVSFINEVAALCEAVGADVSEVRRGMASDGRIGPRFLFPGLGFGGSCFPKDLRSLARVGLENNIRMHSCEAAALVNQEARERFLNRIARHFGDDLAGKTLAFWGLAFKPRTDDVRESPAVWIIQQLLSRWPAARILAYDPTANETARAVIGDAVVFSRSNYDILENADALVICTEWNEFRSPDFDRMKGLMKSPVIFDGRNLYEPDDFLEMGFTYYCVGRPTVRPS